MAKRQPPRAPDRHEIEIELDGKTYKGSYTLEHGMITVNLYGGASTTTQWSQTHNHDTLARVILAELVAKQR